MSKFIKAALKYYYTVFVFALFILILGLVAIFFTPTDIFPEINTPAVVAVWNYNGMPAKDVENRIVSIAERAYSANMNDVEHIESQSLYGVGVIKVFLHPGADVNTAITQLSSATSVRCVRFSSKYNKSANVKSGRFSNPITYGRFIPSNNG